MTQFQLYGILYDAIREYTGAKSINPDEVKLVKEFVHALDILKQL